MTINKKELWISLQNRNECVITCLNTIKILEYSFVLYERDDEAYTLGSGHKLGELDMYIGKIMMLSAFHDIIKLRFYLTSLIVNHHMSLDVDAISEHFTQLDEDKVLTYYEYNATVDEWVKEC